MTLEELIKEFKELNCHEYNSWKGDHCYRITGLYVHFIDWCNKLNLKPTWIKDGLYAEAFGKGFSLSYCERDITICLYKEKEKQKYNLKEFILKNSLDVQYILENKCKLEENELWDYAYNLKPDFAEEPQLLLEKYSEKEVKKYFDDIYDDYIEETLLPALKEILKDYIIEE